MSPPELSHDLLGEILVRIPPEEPADLVRAALVCKPWLRVLSDSAFRRGYRDRHRTPPLLGFVHNIYDKGPSPRFVPATASPCSWPALDWPSWWALDSRHGRVLMLHRFEPDELIVWNPITGDLQHLPAPPYSYVYFTGAFVCSAAGCNHLDCRDGPFLVVFVGTDDEDIEEDDVTWASVYSSETGGWSAMTTVDLSDFAAVDPDAYIETTPSRPLYIETSPSLLTGGALYFTLELGRAILKYDLAGGILSVIDASDALEPTGVLMEAEGGGLGCANVKFNCLYLWSWLTGDDEDAGWMPGKIIELETLIPVRNRSSVSKHVIGFAEGTDTVFLDTEDGVFTLEIKSGKTRRIGERRAYGPIIPYMSFCNPDNNLN